MAVCGSPPTVLPRRRGARWAREREMTSPATTGESRGVLLTVETDRISLLGSGAMISGGRPPLRGRPPRGFARGGWGVKATREGELPPHPSAKRRHPPPHGGRAKFTRLGLNPHAARRSRFVGSGPL